jgi:SAM-dependent methyltransferase
MKCALCQHENAGIKMKAGNVHGRHMLGPEVFPVYECGSCGVLFTGVKVDESYYRMYYPQGYYREGGTSAAGRCLIECMKQLGFLYKYRLIKKFKPAAGSLFEIGCGTGDFLRRLPRNLKKSGLEVNREAIEFLKKNDPGISVFDRNLETYDWKKENKVFDVIVMWHVFEHIENPGLFVEKLGDALASDGVIILEIPNRNSLGFRLTGKRWFHLDTPRHLFHYNRFSAEKVFERCSLKPIFYSGNPVDYFHDLAASVYSACGGLWPAVRIPVVLCVLPGILLVRFVAALFFSGAAETNIYVLKHAPLPAERKGRSQ